MCDVDVRIIRLDLDKNGSVDRDELSTILDVNYFIIII